MTDTIQPPASLPAIAKPPIQKIGYHGDVGDIIGLHVINLLLNICTLGVYSFWGKTRIRRYMTSHLTLGKDSFQYTGTGAELFFGWIKALIIFIPLVILLMIPFVNLVVYPIFFGLIAAAIYLAMRYRLSRTTWRGVRFSLGGSAMSYLWLSVRRALVNFFTLGLKIPKSDIIKWTYLANNIKYGETTCTYSGDHTKLFRIHIATIGISIGLFFIYGGYLGFHIDDFAALKTLSAPTGTVVATPEQAEKAREVAELAAAQAISSVFTLIVPIYAVMFGALVARMWYHAALWQEKFRGLRLGELRFKLDVTAPAMIKMYALNLAILIFTLGLGAPITTHLIVRFFTSRLKIGGDIEAFVVEQNKTPLGTGMGDALAADVGFDLGL